ncbi:ribonuclease P protein component [Deltaproteobacteria bacterium OttesenSCG-928-K17]|nr:ribonuclease P protein component [Deltaproteobacteria bacterium OttesenSCG-928-K17]
MTDNGGRICLDQRPAGGLLHFRGRVYDRAVGESLTDAVAGILRRPEILNDTEADLAAVGYDSELNRWRLVRDFGQSPIYYSEIPGGLAWSFTYKGLLDILGVTVTKKVGSAVTRNRLKRQVREFFRHNRRFWPVGFDLVIIARHGAAHKSGAELAADLKRAGQKLEAMAAEGGRNDTPPKNGGDSPEARGGAIRPITGGDA